MHPRIAQLEYCLTYLHPQADSEFMRDLHRRGLISLAEARALSSISVKVRTVNRKQNTKNSK
jgi:hypothetical protein